jgi:hypothetical protein
MKNRAQTVARFWRISKTSLLGVYHKAMHKYLPRYCGLFQYSFNSRMNLEWLITCTEGLKHAQTNYPSGSFE